MLLSPSSEATAEGQGTGNLSPPNHTCTLAQGQAQPKLSSKVLHFYMFAFGGGLQRRGWNSLIWILSFFCLGFL